MAFERCETCGEYGHFGETVFKDHKCEPKWSVREHEENFHPGDWRTVHAADAEAAAEKYGEHDCEDCEMIDSYQRGNGMRLEVLDKGKIRTFQVTVEFEPEFSAMEVE